MSEFIENQAGLSPVRILSFSYIRSTLILSRNLLLGIQREFPCTLSRIKFCVAVCGLTQKNPLPLFIQIKLQFFEIHES